MTQDYMFSASSVKTAPQMLLPPPFIASFCLLTLRSNVILLKSHGMRDGVGIPRSFFQARVFIWPIGHCTHH